MDGWMDGWMNGWMDGWMDVYMYIYILYIHISLICIFIHRWRYTFEYVLLCRPTHMRPGIKGLNETDISFETSPVRLFQLASNIARPGFDHVLSG